MPEPVPETVPVELVIEDGRWRELNIEIRANLACRTTLETLGIDPARCEIALLACDDVRISELNRDFRRKPQPTNVLSWPAEDLAADQDGAAPLPPLGEGGDFPIALGDIAIAYDTTMREAAEMGIPAKDHLTHLLIHGCLHLLGYDHVSEKDAALMEQLEVTILAKLGIADPY
ncbi:MAG: rRNA maturation RNase YbeY [Rhodobacteraceae bacterium]|nr:rRNA maturation RNase YbeY [Paracoccaceae bacterium]